MTPARPGGGIAACDLGHRARLAWRPQLDLVAQECDLLASHIERDHLDTSPTGLTARRRHFADVVSLYTGAYVLADGLSSRAGVIGRIVVSHAPSWRGPPEPHPRRAPDHHDVDAQISDPDAADPTPVDLRHLGHDVTTLRLADGVVDTDLLPGDHDARVLDLRVVRSLVDARTGELVVKLVTGESCGVVAACHPDQRCLGVATDGSREPAVAPRVDAGERGRLDVVAGGRIAAIDGATAVVSHGEDGARLVLAHQPGRLAGGLRVFSAASGGLLEHTSSTSPGDVDEFGSPSPLRAVLREAEEELGIEVDADDATPVAVILANARGPARADGRADGEVSAKVCFLALSELTPAEVERRRARRSDWTKGRHQLDSVGSLLLRHSREVDDADASAQAAESADAANSASASASVADDAAAFVDRLDAAAGRLDQEAVVCALYAAAHAFGPDPVLAALTAPGRGTWWQRPWRGDAEGRDRLVCSPSGLFGNREAEIAAAHPGWAAACRSWPDAPAP